MIDTFAIWNPIPIQTAPAERVQYVLSRWVPPAEIDDIGLSQVEHEIALELGLTDFDYHPGIGTFYNDIVDCARVAMAMRNHCHIAFGIVPTDSPLYGVDHGH